VIGGALLGVSVWKERMSALNWLGIAFATVALVLLNF
jgi:multidrug transporter EmrE-like cation transporter